MGYASILDLGAQSFAAHTNESNPGLRWGDDGARHKWTCYPYEIDTQYPYAYRLPSLDEFPKILACFHLPESDQEIVISQLRTLSRCNFIEIINPDYETGFRKWQAWWNSYGSELTRKLKTEGRTYPESWKLVARSRGKPCPSYPISLPLSWAFTLRFSSGDYSGVVEEEISMEVSPSSASLKRRYRSNVTAAWIKDDMLVGGRKQDPPWVLEEWSGLTVSEAQRFLAALIYAIDNPWLFAGDRISERDGPESGHIRGRPPDWTTYAAGTKWTGITDNKGNVLINDDVWNWDVNSASKADRSGLDSTIGVVFRVVRDAFPDPVWDRWYLKKSRWKLRSTNTDGAHT